MEMSGRWGPRGRAANRWARLRQTFWFIPSVMCLGAVVLAEALILVDRRIGDLDLGPLDFLITRVGESGSRDLLGAIAGSMLTVASTTFSITIAVLALASSTYGPRLVRNFMADRGNQLVLGVFVATFLYSLMVLRSIRVIGEDDSGSYFVPHLAVNMAVLLAGLSIGVLVYFIHHISDSVQVWTLADQVRVDLRQVIDRLYDGAQDHSAEVREQDIASDVAVGSAVTADAAGYVQGIDFERLVGLGYDHDLLIRMHVRPGMHLATGATLAVVTAPGPLSDQVREGVRRAVGLGRSRNPQQDVQFPALLLEEMAVRALSPGTNDPYTAITALDSLADGLVTLAGRPVPSPYRCDQDGRRRVIAPAVSLIDIVEHLADAIRFYALEHPPVLHRFLRLLAQVGEACLDPDASRALAPHADHLYDAFAATSPQPRDLASLGEHAARVRASCLDR